MNRTCATLFAALLLALPAAAFAQQPDDVKPFMKAKLEHMKRLVEGLAIEDYGVLAKHAQELSLISQAAGWEVLQTADYRRHSTEFRRTADSLREAAQKKNLDGATLLFVELTMKCVQCHKYVRNTKPIHFEGLPPLDRHALLGP